MEKKQRRDFSSEICKVLVRLPMIAPSLWRRSPSVSASILARRALSSVTDERPLAGYRVIEMGQLIAGPFTGTILAYFGAEVIKIEPPGKGDPIRVWRELDENGTSAWWRSIGRNKKSIALDLKSDDGRAIVKELAAKSDVLIENFRPGTLEKWGLDQESLKEVNSSLVFARLSGYGQTGPHSARPGFASVCEAFGGFRHINGFEDRPPVRPNISMGDTLAGIHAALGTVMALLSQQRAKATGRAPQGEVVDVAIYESVFNLMEVRRLRAFCTRPPRAPPRFTWCAPTPSRHTLPCGRLAVRAPRPADASS